MLALPGAKTFWRITVTNTSPPHSQPLLSYHARKAPSIAKNSLGREQLCHYYWTVHIYGINCCVCPTLGSSQGWTKDKKVIAYWHYWRPPLMEAGSPEETSRLADLLLSSAICNISPKLFKVCKDRSGGTFADILPIIGRPVSHFVCLCSQSVHTISSDWQIAEKLPLIESNIEMWENGTHGAAIEARHAEIMVNTALEVNNGRQMI